MPGVTTTTVVSAAPATSTSTCPTPTVSIITGSYPTASKSCIAAGTAKARPPECPRVAIERMKDSSPARSSIRIRSPRIAPPVRGEDGSTAKTANLSPASENNFRSLPVSVDFPEPGAPVIPTTCVLPDIWCANPAIISASSPPRSMVVKSLPRLRRSPFIARSKSSVDELFEAVTLHSAQR